MLQKFFLFQIFLDAVDPGDIAVMLECEFNFISRRHLWQMFQFIFFSQHVITVYVSIAWQNVHDVQWFQWFFLYHNNNQYMSEPTLSELVTFQIYRDNTHVIWELIYSKHSGHAGSHYFLKNTQFPSTLNMIFFSSRCKMWLFCCIKTWPIENSAI